MTLYIKGNMAYETTGENTYIKKKMTYIALSKAEPKDYKAGFVQTILLDDQSVGKEIDKEKNTINISAYCVDYIGKPKIDGKKIEVRKNFAIPVTFEYALDDDKELVAKQLKTYFKAKKNEVIELTVVGKIVEGATIVNVTLDDIPDDIKELIELNYYTEEEALEACAVGNNNREKRMIIVKPYITVAGNDDKKIPTVAINKDKYNVNDLEFFNDYLASLNVDDSDDNYETIEPTSDDNEDDDFMALLNDI